MGLTIEYECVIKPCDGEVVGGDFCKVIKTKTYQIFLIGDVTGHGVKANKIATEIENYLSENYCSNIEEMFLNVHNLLIGTIGVALGCFKIDFEGKRFTYAGVGNTGATRCIGERWSGVSKDGILGQRLPTFYFQTGEVQNGDIFLMKTDGLPQRESKNFIIDNAGMSIIKIANKLIATHGRSYDDRSCIIIKVKI